MIHWRILRCRRKFYREDLEEMVEEKVFFDVETEKYVAPIESENMVQSAWEVNGLIQKLKGVKK